MTVDPLPGIPRGVLVTLDGPIDTAQVVTFQSTLEQLNMDGTRHFVLECSRMPYSNSTGLGSLVRMADQMNGDGMNFVLADLHPKAAVVFEHLGLMSFLRIYPSVAEAIEAISAG